MVIGYPDVYLGAPADHRLHVDAAQAIAEAALQQAVGAAHVGFGPQVELGRAGLVLCIRPGTSALSTTGPPACAAAAAAASSLATQVSSASGMP